MWNICKHAPAYMIGQVLLLVNNKKAKNHVLLKHTFIHTLLCTYEYLYHAISNFKNNHYCYHLHVGVAINTRSASPLPIELVATTENV